LSQLSLGNIHNHHCFARTGNLFAILSIRIEVRLIQREMEE
jgi:hypothetical protein